MDKYEMLQQIGKGTYGEVFLALHKFKNQQVAIKQLDLRQKSQKDVQSATLEAQLLAEFTHTNIVSYVDSFFANGFLNIVMEHCENGTLDKKLNECKHYQHRLSEEQIGEWFAQLCQALEVRTEHERIEH
ncbi:unnamed protein product [Didymodactylos carnosus]|uniref:non-specific serine/threonine protein kinase n=1 Tax=Didymodactylos carnosus TaxID=1234261 RepID=A0A814PHH5_9BILA|nr:unnamed protein product [Didymodactylos carnosus]CAF1346086.1 unnamed protein product [Didymodactylos carnosus]CAF3868836.1 unnamed protein product [Didymodactylos carnosus]CAF4156973.1 unnamed protein product [Didymodactylos carnosus]